MKRKIVCLCGSLRFKKDFGDIELMLVLRGSVVLTPCLMYVDIERTMPQYKEMVDEIHKSKIELADEIYVINKNNYVGKSTSEEIEYAHSIGKPIIFMEDPESEGK